MVQVFDSNEERKTFWLWLCMCMSATVSVCECAHTCVTVMWSVMTVAGLDAVNTDTVSRHPPLNKHKLPVVSA